jgi:Gram-negative bacterial TonB protein C-terminal
MANSARKSLFIVLVTLGLRMLALGQSQDQTTPPSPPETPAQQGVPQRVRISAGVMTGMLIKRSRPEYPEKARRERIQGVVARSASINKQGDVAHLDTISGDPLLAKAAINAVEALEIPSIFFKQTRWKWKLRSWCTSRSRQLDHPSRIAFSR